MKLLVKKVIALIVCAVLIVTIVPWTAIGVFAVGVSDETVTYAYAYDVYREPPFPRNQGEKMRLYYFDNPLKRTTEQSPDFESYEPPFDFNDRYESPAGQWTLTKVGTFAEVQNSDCNVSEYFEGVVENAFYASTHITGTMDEMVIHKLSDENGELVGYGVVVGVDETNGYAIFIADNWDFGGAGYFLSQREIAEDEKEVIFTAEKLAETETVYYNIWLGGVEFTSENLLVDRDDNPDISGYAEYDPATRTLTLNNLSYEYTGGISGDEGVACLYYSEEDSSLTIVLNGENFLRNVNTDEITCAMYVVGHTTITGGGSLVAEAGSSDSYAYVEGMGCAIYAPVYLAIKDTSVTAASYCGGESCYGIFSTFLAVDNANVVAKGITGAILPTVDEEENCAFYDVIRDYKVFASTSLDGSDAFAYPEYATVQDHLSFKYIQITNSPAESEEVYYDVWCGGVQFSANNLVIDSADDPVISGSATFDPATNTVTLNNFQYEGVGYYDQYCSYGLYSESSLNLVLVGENQITCTANKSFSYAVRADGDLTISGGGTLRVRATHRSSWKENFGYATAIESDRTMTIDNASVTAMADATTCIFGLRAKTMVFRNAAITAKATGISDDISGLFVESLTLDNVTMEVSGTVSVLYASKYTNRFTGDFTGHTVFVSDSIDGANLVSYTGDELYNYKYMKVVPEDAGFTFESIRTANGQNISVDHENKKISVEVAEGDYLQLYVHQKEHIPGGTIKMKSYNGNKVEYNTTGIYKIYSINSEYITVVANITINGQTEVYDLVVHFAEKAEEVPFSSIRTGNGTVTKIDHEKKEIYVDVNVGDDNLVLYVHQQEHIAGGQVRMNSYNGNKVTYDASGVYRIYTLGSKEITVSAKVIVGGETYIYDLIANFNAGEPDFSFDEINCDNAQGIEIDHEAKTIRIYAEENAEYVTLYKKQYDQTKGTLVLTSFMGNRVQSNQTDGTYKVCFVKNKEVSVKGNFTINGVVENYTITIVFSPEWKFDNLKIDSASSVSIDHDSKTVTVNASSDAIVLYIDQVATKGDAQVWMQSYNGNKVTYNASARTYTITKGEKDSLTVRVKITIFDETRYYDLIVNFAE